LLLSQPIHKDPQLAESLLQQLEAERTCLSLLEEKRAFLQATDLHLQLVLLDHPQAFSFSVIMMQVLL